MCLSDQLATEPPDDGSVDATAGKVSDRNWAQLLGAAAVPVDEADLRIEDVEALVVRLLDFAVDEWLALEHAEEWPGNRSHDFDEADDRPTSEAAAVDRDMVGAAAAFADDRTRDEARGRSRLTTGAASRHRS